MDSSQQRVRLLLVEDSEDDAELIRQELEMAGIAFHSRRVDDRASLEQSLASQPWDLVLSDFAMPGFNGLEAFEIVDALHLDIPFVFVSGAIGEERAVAAMRAGARDYILKGNLRRLAGVVQREIAALQSRRERREAEASARQEAQRLSMAVEASGAGIFEYDLARDANPYFSRRWASMLGFRPEELPPSAEMPAWFLERLHADDREEAARGYRALITGRTQRLATEIRVRHRDESWMVAALFLKPAAHDEDGRVTRVLGVMVDLTERRKLEEELRQSQRMEAVGRLAGGVAHDFNNLLTVIFAFGEFVFDALDEQSPVRDDMEQVLEAARRAAELTGQLLAFSRRQTLEPRVLNANDLIRGLEKMLTRVLGEDIELRTCLDPGLHNIRVDSGAFEQVVVNLALNARDAMPEGGRLTIDTGNLRLDASQNGPMATRIPAGDYVRIEIEDDGLGMDPDTMTQVFEPFFTTKGPGKGTGLGLSTCYGIIQQARGYIRLHSAPGRGTRFELLLPQVSSEVEPVRDQRRTNAVEGSETVLVVEDEAQVRQLVERTLKRHGYRVLTAEDAEQALAVCDSGEVLPDLLLTDIVLTGMDGTRLAKEIRQRFPQMLVLFMSGYAPDSLSRERSLAPEAAILHKPFRPDQLLRMLRSTLDTQERAQ
jgi:PAS domain S-box-containing protein